jgi:hypothetical protein
MLFSIILECLALKIIYLMQEKKPSYFSVSVSFVLLACDSSSPANTCSSIPGSFTTNENRNLFLSQHKKMNKMTKQKKIVQLIQVNRTNSACNRNWDVGC